MHAVVYAQLTYCGRRGEGTYLYLSKETGAWHIVGRAGTWILQDFEWYDHGTQTKWPELNRVRPAIPAYVSLLNVWSRIEPFTDEASHFALLVNRHLFSTGVVIAEIAHYVRYLSVGDFVPELYERNRFVAIEIVTW